MGDDGARVSSLQAVGFGNQTPELVNVQEQPAHSRANAMVVYPVVTPMLINLAKEPMLLTLLLMTTAHDQ